MITTSLKTLFIAASIFFSSVLVHASAGHSSTAAGNWQADIDLSYREKSGPNMLGFIPTNQHEESAGFRLNHFDLSYQTVLPTQIGNQSISDQQTGRLALAYHSSDIELSEAWLANDWHSSGLRLTAGKYLPRIGFLNHRHQHAQTFQQTPLLNKVYWGDQLAEAGANLQWAHPLLAANVRHSFNILGGDHLNSKKDTLAALYQLEWQYAVGSLNTTLLANGYFANVEDRGMFLFDLTTTSHVHSNSRFSEYFDGEIQHLGAGAQLRYNSAIGNWGYQMEYSQRTEKGDLYNDTSSLADIEQRSNGQYHQLWWQSSNTRLLMGLRYDYLHSDTEVSNTNDSSLDNSRLNNDGNTPERLTLMLSWQLAQQHHQQIQQQKLQLLYSDGLDWQAYSARFELHLLQSFRF